jgi:nucleotide-binding universal stress UspA family protein
MKYLIVHDGTLSARKLLRYGLERAVRTGASVMVLSVFPAPLFSGYEGMHAEARARREYEASLEDTRAVLKTFDDRLDVSLYSADGDPEEVILSTAESEQVGTILLTPRYRRIQRKTSVPVAIVPGTLLLPVDSSNEAMGIIGQVAQEARESGSSVIILGVVPVHLYSRSEKMALRAVEEATLGTMNRVLTVLRAEGVDARPILRSGYPDDEILRAANEFTISTVIFPQGGVAPSELRKAAHVLLAEREQARVPLLFVPAAEGA